MMNYFLMFWFFIFLIERSALSQLEQNTDIISLIRRLESKMDRLEESVKKGVERDQQLIKSFGKFEKKVDGNAKRIQSIWRFLTPFRELRYYIAGVTWSDAEYECKKWGGHLVTIRSEAANKYLLKETTRRKMGYSIWIGLNDKKEEGKFVWSSEEEAVYKNWRAGEPNGGRGENCVEFTTTLNGTWNDHACARKFPFVCERNIF